MIVCIKEILGLPDRERVRDLLSRGAFVSGKETAGWASQPVKHNLQLSAQDPVHPELARLIVERLSGHSVFQSAVLPKSFRPPVFSRYEPGMHYGAHVDDAIMGTPVARSDVSYTLFLSPPEDYVGGELVLEDTYGEHSFKLDAGDLVLYPSKFLHRVEPVEAGIRLAAVGWVQSLCRDPSHREVLFDLQQLREKEFSRHSKSAEFDLLSKTYSNLLRMFADP